MKNKLLASFLMVVLFVGMIGAIKTNAASNERATELWHKNRKVIGYTYNKPQRVWIEAQRDNIVIIMKDNRGRVLWESWWSNEYLDHRRSGPKGYSYSHEYWCGPEVYSIEAYSFTDGGRYANPVYFTGYR